MPSKWTISTITLVALLGAASAQVTMVPGEFNAVAYNQMMDCVKASSTRYDVAVDEGRVIIAPPEGEDLDLDGEDSALGECLDKMSSSLKLGVDDGRDGLEGLEILPIEEATAEWAQSNGAQGITPQNGTINALNAERRALGGSLLSRDVKQYFYSYGSYEDKKCEHHDQQISYIEKCRTFGKAYKSIRFGNADKSKHLRVSMWPHHDCAVDYPKDKKGTRTITVKPNAESSCEAKDTFSFHAKYT